MTAHRAGLVLVALFAGLPATGWADLWSAPETTTGNAPRSAERATRTTTARPTTAGALRLGTSAPLSGEREAAGAILRTAQALLHAQGDVDVVLEDDGGVPVRAVPAARRLETVNQIVAFLSPLETPALGGLMAYLQYTSTPTLFVGTTIGARLASPRVIGLPPRGAAVTRALARHAGEVLDERVRARRQRPPSQGLWVFVTAGADGEDRRNGLATLVGPDVSVVDVTAEGELKVPRERAPDVALIIGPPSQAAAIARRLARLPVACGDGARARDVAAADASCVPAPALVLSLFEPFDWSELTEPHLRGALAAEWLAVTPAARAAHERVLRRAKLAGPATPFTVWGHGLSELVTEVARRAGPRPDGDAMLRATFSLREWTGSVLPPITITASDRAPVKDVQLVALTAGLPEVRRARLRLE